MAAAAAAMHGGVGGGWFRLLGSLWGGFIDCSCKNGGISRRHGKGCGGRGSWRGAGGERLQTFIALLMARDDGGGVALYGQPAASHSHRARQNGRKFAPVRRCPLIPFVKPKE